MIPVGEVLKRIDEIRRIVYRLRSGMARTQSVNQHSGDSVDAKLRDAIDTVEN